MGNNNSSQHRRYGHHHQNYNGQQWSQSLDDSHMSRDPRNRMKKGYFPAMGPPGARGGGLIPAAKVLPKVDPVAAAMRLKPTSNGAILNGGGTISGRKLQMMHELQMTGGQGPVSGGFLEEDDMSSEKDLGRRRHASSSSMHGNQPAVGAMLSGGLSTPNLLAMEDEFPASNDFSRRSQRSIGGHRIILDKPSKGEGFGGSQPDLTRYIEDDDSRGRSASPPEPNSFTLIGESPAKKQIRTKKKYPAPAPPPVTVEPGQNEQKKSNRLFKTKAESKLSGSGAERHSIGGSTSSSSGGERKVLADSSIILTPLKSEKPWIHKMFAEQNDLNKEDGNRKKKAAPVPEVKASKSKPPAPAVPKSSNKTSISSTTAISVDEGRKKITTSTTTHTTSSKSSTQILVEPKDTQLPKYYYEEKREEGEKSKFYFGMDDSSAAAAKTKPTAPSPVKAESPEVKNIVVEMKLNEETKKVKSEAPKPELESNSLFLSRQQKVMETQESKREETSFSDLSSSSDVDIPMLIRPTLPHKRMDLPRFSPCEAWRALDSPRASGRSLSSEDGFSYEDRIRRYTRPYAPPRTGTERSGDSGISAGDTASPAHNIPGEMMEQRELHSRSTTTSQNKIQIRKTSVEHVECWTPEHDLDESSSEFEHDLGVPQDQEKRLEQTQQPLPLGSQTPPKFTTRSHLFAKNPARSGGAGSSQSPSTPEPERYLHRQHLYSKSSKLGAGKLRQRQVTRDPMSDEEGPRSEIQRNEGYAKKKYQSDFVGLDTNWFLSRSEPNSLNVLCSEGKSPKLSVAPGLLDEIFPQDGAGKGQLVPECRSEIGYGPSSMTFLSSGEESRSRHGGRHFSHIMYLPSYDSRRASPYYPNSRRTKSVDHLDESRLFRKTTEFTSLNAEQRWSRRDFLEVQSADDWETQEEVEYFNDSTDEPLELANESVNNRKTVEVKQTPSAEDLEREQKRKKYKFQSTLRVQERKKLEEQLAREAREMEEQRLREVEAMKRVEEEFQRKRAQKEAREIIAQANNNKALQKTEQRIHQDWNMHSRAQQQQQHHNNNFMNNFRNADLSQRQEPEGAPAPGSDLRKELIHASKKRSARPPSEMTQELSEYRQESPREYYDYRRSPRATSASPARFMESSSDIYPNARRAERGSHMQNRYKTTTVHPEVVCDIPVKPLPFMVNFSSRPSGSTSNLLLEDLPNASYAASGPPSVISDNYRRDWAHHHNGVRGGGGPGRASSIGSLHSGHMSEVLRQSATDLSAVHDRRSTKSPLVHKYSSSPPSSPMPPLSSSNASEFTDFDKDSSSVITSSHSPSSGVFKIQPYKSKEYRPVAFKPASSNNFKLASTVVQ